MTFSEESINNIAIDMADEWEYGNNDTEINCKFYGLEDYAERWFQRGDNYPDGWLDCYAIIVLNGNNERYVRQIEFVLVTNDDTQDRYLTISMCNDREGRMIASKLYETSHGGLEQMENDLEAKA